MKKGFLILILCSLIIPINTKALANNSSIIMDIDSGRILYENNADQKKLIASITKIMTAIIVLENSNLDDKVTVGEEVLTMYGSNIYIELNEKMTVRDLLYGLLLRSGNDAAIVLAKYVGKDIDVFVKMMNDKANDLEMTNTLFSNPHGLDEETQNYSSAKDMAKLSSYAYHNDNYREITRTKKYVAKTEGKTYLWYNRNKLLNTYKFATGGKTGYTPKAGRTLVTTAFKDGLNLTCVTLNDNNEYNTHQELYENSFKNYQNYKIINPTTFSLNKIYYQDKLVIKESFNYPLSNLEKSKIKTIAKITKTKDYQNNEQVGDLIIKLNNKEIKQIPLYVELQKKEQRTFFKKWLSFFKSLQVVSFL